MKGIVRYRLPPVYAIDLRFPIVFWVGVRRKPKVRVNTPTVSGRNGNGESEEWALTLFRATVNGVFLSLSSLSDSRVWGSNPHYKGE